MRGSGSGDPTVEKPAAARAAALARTAAGLGATHPGEPACTSDALTVMPMSGLALPYVKLETSARYIPAGSRVISTDMHQLCFLLDLGFKKSGNRQWKSEWHAHQLRQEQLRRHTCKCKCRTGHVGQARRGMPPGGRGGAGRAGKGEGGGVTLFGTLYSSQPRSISRN